MIKYTILSIIYAHFLIYIGISDISIITKFVLFAIIDFIFAKIVNFVKNPFKEEVGEDLSFRFLIFSIVLQLTYGAFLISEHSNKNIRIFGIVLLIICLCAIVYLIINIISVIKEIIIEFKKSKFRSKIKFKLDKINGIDNKIIFLQNEIDKLSEKDGYKIEFLYSSIIVYSLDEIDEIYDKIAFLQNELEKLSEKDKIKKGYLEFKIKFLNEEKIKEEERIAREKAEEEELDKVYNEMAGYVENKDFLETDLDHIFGEDEGCFLIIDNVGRYTRNERRFNEMYRGTLYITNKKLWIKSYQKTNPIMVLVPLTDILEIYRWEDIRGNKIDALQLDEYNGLKLIIEKTNKKEEILLKIDEDIDYYRAYYCIWEAKKYL